MVHHYITELFLLQMVLVLQELGVYQSPVQQVLPLQQPLLQNSVLMREVLQILFILQVECQLLVHIV